MRCWRAIFLKREILRAQAAAASVTSREVTGVGFFTTGSVPADLPRLSDLAGRTLSDVGAELIDVEHGVGFHVERDEADSPVVHPWDSLRSPRRVRGRPTLRLLFVGVAVVLASESAGLRRGCGSARE
jgi:hypothetical protein